MRVASRLRPLVLLLLLPLLLVGRVSADEAPFIPDKDARDLERVLQGIARKGHPEGVERLGDIMRDLHVPEARMRGLSKAKTRAEKAASKPKDASAEAKKLRKIGDRLATGLAERNEAERLQVARTILQIDAANRAAHEALGHVEHDGQWLPSWMPALLERRAEISAFLTKARHLQVPIETGTVDEPLLMQLHGRKANFAKGGGLYLSSCTWSQQSLKRIAQQIARARYFSHWILGQSDVPDPTPLEVRIVEKNETYVRAFDIAKAQGLLADDVAKTARRFNSFYDKQWRFLLEAWYETDAMTSIYHWVGRERLQRTFEHVPQEALTVGHMNWIALSIFGLAINDTVYFDEEDEAARRGDRSVAKDPIPGRRTRMMRIAKAGVHGLRSWLSYLTRMGEAPRWNEGFLSDNARIQGNARVKCIYAAAMLQESRELAKVMRDSLGANRETPAEIQAEIEKSLSRSLDDFERRFREWLLFVPGAPGLAQRLGGAKDAAPVPGHAEAAEAVRILDGLRERSLTGKATTPKLMADDDLGRGCLAHARFLTLHEDLWDQWPQVHEETVDRKGFTPEGNRGGLNGVIAFQCTGPEDAIEQWMGTFFHRLPLLQPGLVGIGWGLQDGIAVLDCGSLVDLEVSEHYALWPPAGAKDVPLRFTPELPNPIPGEDQAAWGYPITLQYPQIDSLLVLELALYQGSSAAGVPVECHVITPQAPKNPDLAPPNTWCLIPKVPLAPNTSYCVGVKDSRPEAYLSKLRWTFKTGRE